MKSSFAVVDTETNGLNWGSDILEIAIVILHPVTLETLSEFHSLVKPTIKNTVGRTDIHEIDMNMLKNAPVLKDLADEIRQHLNGKILVSHNLEFDQEKLVDNISHHGGQINPGTGVCTLELTGEKLTTVANKYGIPSPKAHSALSDARVAAAILRMTHHKWYKKHFSPASLIWQNADSDSMPTKPRLETPKRLISPASEKLKRQAVAELNARGIFADASMFIAPDSAELSQLLQGMNPTPEMLQKTSRYGGNQPATERQKDYANDLLEENGIYHIDVERMSRTEISSLIDLLLSDPSRVAAMGRRRQSAGCFTFQTMTASATSTLLMLLRKIASPRKS